MSANRQPTAFLFPAFPVLHQTFVLWEVLQLRQHGVAIELYSIKRPRARTQQPEGAALAKEVRYLPWTLSRAVLGANLKTLLRRPRRYLGVYGKVVREWWRDRHAGRKWRTTRIAPDAPERLRTIREVLGARFNRTASLFLLKSLWLVPRAVYLGQQLQARGIHRVHAHWASYPTTVALVIHWLFDMPFSFTAHAYDIYIVPRLLRSKVNAAEFVVTCAQVNAAHLRSLAGQTSRPRIVVNYHGVSLHRFRPRACPPPHTMPCVVTCGRLEPYKGHHVLLRACARLRRPVRCLIVGDGPQRGRLAQLATQLGIDDRVEFTGPLPQAELVRRYEEADVFVLASVILGQSGKRDVIPNVLAEAMAMQLPVVASDISGIGELITDGESGRLVRANDPQALALVLDELLRDEDQRRRLGMGGYRKVKADFNRDVNIRALAELFLSSAEAPVAPGTPAPPPQDIGARVRRLATSK
ncbi:MAG: glycosyltransferase family 4 protein [Candidatus Binatia bacterium]